MRPVMDEAALAAFYAERFPQAAGEMELAAITDEGARMRMRPATRHLRPGGTLSGPAMFGLADVCFYLAVLSRIGPEALAVTVSSAIDFMRRPQAEAPLLAEARLLKLGRRLAVGDVLLTSAGAAGPVARASMTYALPPRGENMG